MLGIGVVNEGYDTCKLPGWKDGSVGYHTDGNLYDAANNDYGRETKGMQLAIPQQQHSNAARVRNIARFAAAKLPGNSKKKCLKKSKDKAVIGKRSFS